MATNAFDTEKAFTPYTDDENAPPKATVELPFLTRLRKQRSRRFSWTTAFLTAVIVTLVVARLVEGPVRARWHKNIAGHDNSKPVSPIRYVESSSRVIQAQVNEAPVPVADSMEAVTSHPADVSKVSVLNDPADLDGPAHANDIGVSIAASVDSDGSRQVYDLDAEGTIRIRKIENGTYRYTPPEVVATKEKPKAASPMSALVWRGNGLSLEHRLYYLNQKTQLVELAGTSVNATAPTAWRVKSVVGITASGGLAAINIGPRYDPKTVAGQIRVFYVDRKGRIQCLNTLKDKWYINFSKFTAIRGSDVAVNAIRDSKTGQVTDMSIIYVDPKNGLKEFVCDEKNKRNQYFPARPVDPTFSTTSPAHFASTFGGPPPISRVYTLTSKAAVERTGARDGSYTTDWWQTADNSFYVPEAPGGNVAAIAWGDKEVRVFYKSKAEGKLAEVGVSAQQGDGVKWFPRGYIN